MKPGETTKPFASIITLASKLPKSSMKTILSLIIPKEALYIG